MGLDLNESALENRRIRRLLRLGSSFNTIRLTNLMMIMKDSTMLVMEERMMMKVKQKIKEISGDKAP